MLNEILIFLMEVVVTLVGGACLLRFVMHRRAMSTRNPLGRFVRGLSDWLVQPLRRLIPPTGSVDLASLAAAWLLKLLQWTLLLALLRVGRWSVLPVVALVDTVKLGITVAMILVIAAVVLSWTQNRSLLADAIQSLADPLLAPFRRIVPQFGGLDLSPLVALVVLQVGSIVLRSVEGSLLGAASPLGLV